jgi:site-specific DNA-methyltransferase (adenine-specific)
VLLTGDVMDVLPTLEADSFDAMLTDPPYGLSGDGGKTGFMGKEWDGRVPGPDVWRETLRVLKPGAFALVFGGTRTWHRLAVALEDAGFELRDTLMWVYGSGFPKSHAVDKGIDKLLGAERPVVGANPNHRAVSGVNYEGIYAGGNTGAAYITAPATPEAARWQGYGTSLKPAYEPILLVRKPTPLTYAQNALEYGTGALNIDGSRVPWAYEGERAEVNSRVAPNSRYAPEPGVGVTGWGKGRVRATDDLTSRHGRWPANFITDGSAEVVDLFPSTTSRGHTPSRRGKGGLGTNGHSGQEGVDEAYFDTGSAARFFYSTKASTKERNTGLAERNVHPTVKPLALTEYLAKLLLPPKRDTPRRILVPFAGSGSEIIGALRAGWDKAVGIECEAEYVAIAEKRIEHWLKRRCARCGSEKPEGAWTFAPGWVCRDCSRQETT